jgi:hypothetical protein
MEKVTRSAAHVNPQEGQNMKLQNLIGGLFARAAERNRRRQKLIGKVSIMPDGFPIHDENQPHIHVIDEHGNRTIEYTTQSAMQAWEIENAKEAIL